VGSKYLGRCGDNCYSKKYQQPLQTGKEQEQTQSEGGQPQQTEEEQTQQLEGEQTEQSGAEQPQQTEDEQKLGIKKHISNLKLLQLI
jgi:hypothetical protein